MTANNTVVLIILDGWGYSESNRHNAIQAAQTPNWDQLWQSCPHTLIQASGAAVGLPDAQMGNSEVGHLTMGAGRQVDQELKRIDLAIANGDFFHNPVFLRALRQAREQHKAVHVLGLLSPGGIHSHEKHIQALANLAAQEKVEKFYIHAFLDGRDTPPQSAAASIEALEALLLNNGCGKIVSLIGRYYAMDRDQRWERIEKAYDLLAKGQAPYSAATARLGLERAYARGETDEFVQATAIHADGAPSIKMEEGDVAIFMNFRADRARQLTRVLTESDFHTLSHSDNSTHRAAWQHRVAPQLAEFVSLTHYAKTLNTTVAFSPQDFSNTLGEMVEAKGWNQLRIAETEKYAHVTYFINGGRETPFDREFRVLIPSLKVATYDLAPEMSAFKITDALTQAIYEKKYALIICNFANPDMVGHSGNFLATVKAIETVDQCLGRIVSALRDTGSEMIITADHGNAECMFDDETQQPHTAHTDGWVPLIYWGRPAVMTQNSGTLADVAPTLLYLMGLSQPDEMTGKSLMTFE